MHYDAEIRARLVALLTGLPGIGANVTGSRVYRVDESNVPPLAVYVRESEVVDRTVSPATETRAAALIIEIRVAETTTLDDDLDQHRLDVEQALGTDPTLGGILLRLDFVTHSTEVSGELRERFGLATMTYAATYTVPEFFPEYT